MEAVAAGPGGVVDVGRPPLLVPDDELLGRDGDGSGYEDDYEDEEEDGWLRFLHEEEEEEEEKRREQGDQIPRDYCLLWCMRV